MIRYTSIKMRDMTIHNMPVVLSKDPKAQKMYAGYLVIKNSEKNLERIKEVWKKMQEHDSRKVHTSSSRRNLEVIRRSSGYFVVERKPIIKPKFSDIQNPQFRFSSFPLGDPITNDVAVSYEKIYRDRIKCGDSHEMIEVMPPPDIANPDGYDWYGGARDAILYYECKMRHGEYKVYRRNIDLLGAMMNGIIEDIDEDGCSI